MVVCGCGLSDQSQRPFTSCLRAGCGRGTLRLDGECIKFARVGRQFQGLLRIFLYLAAAEGRRLQVARSAMWMARTRV